MGLKMSAKAQNILMLVKISMILILIAAIFFASDNNVNNHVATAPNSITALDWVKSLGVSLIAVSFTYGGYQQTINFGNEVAEPAKNIPRGIFVGIAVIIGLYLLVNVSYYSIIGFENMKGEREIAYVLMEKIFGKKGADVFAFFLFMGVLSYVNALMLSNPRVMYAMGEERALPKLFAKQSSNGALVTSLTVFTAACMVILFFSQQFEQILGFTIFLDCFGMIASSAAIFKLRKQTQHLNGTGIYSMKLFPLLPCIFIAAYLFVGISIGIDTPITALIGFLVLVAFMALYFVANKFKPQV